MTPAAIRSTLEGLRKSSAALRARSAASTLDALGRLLDALRSPGSRGRRALEERLPAATGFSPEGVRAGLAHALEPLSSDALMRLVDDELGGVAALDGRARTTACGFETTAVLLAGALPTPTLLALLAPLVLRSGVLAKTSSHDAVTAACLREMLLAIDPLLAGCLEVVSLPGRDAAQLEALLEADCVVASGTDATVAEIARRVAPPRRAVLRGHRVSVAALGPSIAGEDLEGAAQALAFDVALWDQLGCLSPVAVLVADTAHADALAEALAAALAEAQIRWPRGRVGERAAAQIAHERDEAEFRAAAGKPVRLLAGDGFSVVREDGPRLRPAPLHRFVRIHPCGDAAGILAALRPLGPHLSGVAVAGFGRDRDDFSREVGRLGASRVCAPGRLQAPPLRWHQDGQGVLLPLVRLCDLEPSAPQSRLQRS